MAGLSLVGCGGGGGVAPTAGGGPDGSPSSSSAQRGALAISVAFSDGRALPQFDSLRVIVMGEGMSEYLQTYPSLSSGSGTTQASFSEVPVGRKVVLGIGTQYQSGGNKVRVIGALLASISAGATTQRTLYLDNASGLNAVVNGTKLIGTKPTQVVRWSDGDEDYLATDKQPPQSGPANMLWHGSYTPSPDAGWPQALYFSPPVVTIPDELQRGTVRTQNSVALKKTDNTNFATGTWTCTFEGFEGVMESLSNSSSRQAARVKTTYTGTTAGTPSQPVSVESLDWYVQGQGKVLSLGLDPSKPDTDRGRIRDVLFLNQTSGSYYYYGDSLQPLQALVDGGAASYVRNGGGGNEVVITVALFGVTGATATAGSTQLNVSFSRTLDFTTPAATNPNLKAASYALKINGATVVPTAVSGTGSTVTLTLPTALVAGQSYELVVSNLVAADGTVLPNQKPYNDVRGVVANPAV
jgi:hypothetical protein